jgi:K+ transporter
VSVIFWGLMLVVTLKYVLLILRADNRGEGGIMALTALAAEAAGSTRRNGAPCCCWPGCSALPCSMATA